MRSYIPGREDPTLRSENPTLRSENPTLRSEDPTLRGEDPTLRGDDSTLRTETDAYGKSLYSHTEAADHKVIDRVGDVAEKRGIPRAQVALAWLLSRDGVTAPIVGATKPHHLQDAVAALDVHLTQEEVNALEELYIPHPVTGHSLRQ